MKSNTIKRIKKMIKPYVKTIVFVTIIAIIIDVLALAKPYLVRILIDEFLEKGINKNGVVTTSIISYVYILMVCLENFLDYFNRSKTNIIGESVVFDLRNKLYEYMENANAKFHDKVPSGTLFVRIISDTEDVFALFSDVITTFIKDIFVILGLLGVMVYISYT